MSSFYKDAFCPWCDKEHKLAFLDGGIKGYFVRCEAKDIAAQESLYEADVSRRRVTRRLCQRIEELEKENKRFRQLHDTLDDLIGAYNDALESESASPDTASDLMNKVTWAVVELERDLPGLLEDEGE